VLSWMIKKYPIQSHICCASVFVIYIADVVIDAKDDPEVSFYTSKGFL
jgi:hypothetical protein